MNRIKIVLSTCPEICLGMYAQSDFTMLFVDQFILNGIDAKMYLFENEGHGFRMKNTIDKCRFAEEQFFSKHLDMNDA